MSTQTLELVLPHSLAGRTLRWKFNDGPTAETKYEHTFKSDGTVVYRTIDEGTKGKPDVGKDAKDQKPARKPTPTPYASFEVAQGWHLVSYLSADSGYTLTVLVNATDGILHGFASNEKEWFPLTGTLLP
jgi:hypothetical protein